MSKVETNTIDTVSGSSTMQIGSTNTTTINLGVSGDTVNIPSGVTLANAGTATGFGITGWSSSSGSLLPASASAGIYLGVNSATASNLLDDFEEGTYTYAMTTSGGGTVSNRGGYSKLAYTKIGRMVNVVGKIETSGLGDFASQNGDIRLSLPFAIGNFDDFSEQIASPVMWYNTASMSSMNMLFWSGASNDSFCTLVNVSSTLVDSAIQGNAPGSSFEMKVSITYQAA